MVFQTFALLPWLTVQQNVELGLQARGVPESERRATRAATRSTSSAWTASKARTPRSSPAACGNGSASPAPWWSNPTRCLWTNRFSALDVLTAENLRTELTQLWSSNQFPTKAILVVTHNIEEAVLLADRILVLSANPGRIRAELAVDLPRPRDRHAPASRAWSTPCTGSSPAARKPSPRPSTQPNPPPAGRCPPRPRRPCPRSASAAWPACWRSSPPAAARKASPRSPTHSASKSTTCFRWSTPSNCSASPTPPEARITITDAGREFAAADIDTTKKLFADLAARRAPLVRAIVQALRATNDGTLREGFFLDLLRRGFSTTEARRQLDTAIDWGRYAELFDYHNGELILEPDHPAAAR